MYDFLFSFYTHYRPIYNRLVKQTISGLVKSETVHKCSPQFILGNLDDMIWSGSAALEATCNHFWFALPVSGNRK